MTSPPTSSRPQGIAGLAILLAAGTTIGAISCLSLLSPGGLLEPIWRLNPRARVAFARLGPGGPALLASVSLICALAGAGLWRGRRWGYWLTVALFTAHLVGDVVNAALGIEPRALVGVPIVLGILGFLATRRARAFFRTAEVPRKIVGPSGERR